MKRLIKHWALWLNIKSNASGFTLTEVAVVMGVLGILTLLIATLIVGTTNTFGRLSSETQAMSQLRHSMDVFSTDIRESTSCRIVDPTACDPQNPAQDVLLFTTARPSSGPFILDAEGFPSPQSIILYYIGLSPENATQLVKHQLYYAEDLYLYASPFVLADPAYAGDFILIIDNAGTTISVNRATGAVGGVLPLMPPKPLLNNTTLFDIVRNGSGPIEITIESQTTDRKGHVKTSRMSKKIVARNF